MIKLFPRFVIYVNKRNYCYSVHISEFTISSTICVSIDAASKHNNAEVVLEKEKKAPTGFQGSAPKTQRMSGATLEKFDSITSTCDKLLALGQSQS